MPDATTNNTGKLLLLTHEFSPFRGGAAVYCEELAAALHRAGRPVKVWCGGRLPDRPGEDFGFPVTRLYSGTGLRAGAITAFSREIFQRRTELEGADVLLASVGAHWAFMTATALRPINCRTMTSLFYGSELLKFERSPFWKFMARRFYHRVDHVLAVSNFTRSLIEQSFLGPLVKSIGLAPCACSTAAARPCSGNPVADGKTRLLTLARIHPRKGQLDMARALALLPAELRGNVIYQLAGAGDDAYLDQVRQTCRSAGVACETLGAISPESLAATYRQCDIYAMTSRSLPASVEGFGITYLEAGFHGKPVLAYRSGGASEAVVDNVTGLLVDEGDVPALAAACQRLIVDVHLRRTLGENGRRHAARFSWDSTARAVLQVLG